MNVPLVAVVGAVIASTALVAPADLLAGAAVPAGFELASDEYRTLDFDGFSETSPQSTRHVDAESDEAATLVAGTDVWNLGDDDVLLREVVRWSDGGAADRYVDEIVEFAGDEELDEVDAPFEGGRAFSGDDLDTGVWTRMVVWADGALGVSVTHFSFGGDPSNAVVDTAARSLAERTAPAAGEDPGSDGESGGIPIGTVLFVLALAIGAFVLIRWLLRRRAEAASDGSAPSGGTGGAAPGDDELSVDEMIERARARGRAEREMDAIPDPTESWTPSDDH